MPDTVEAYLDIETTGLSPAECMVTVVGMYICNGEDSRVIQLVGKDITTDSISDALQGVSILHTYNGSRFDLPFIHGCVGIDLAQRFPHRDLMYDCWKNNLRGGLKAVERQLGIERRLKDVNGWEAIKLWWKFVDSGDLDALNTLLEYNKEDVVNLKTLKARLLYC
ncbi:ribonuclease H-like domain-containing protein [Chloroflexota bacterium]